MTIADEITDLQNNLSAAKNAVVAKGGTIGDTGLAGLSSEISTIPSGGGDVALGTITYTKNEQPQTAVIRTTSEFMQLCSSTVQDITIDSQTFKVTDITRVALEDSITYIPDMFLRGATALTSLSFGPLTHIGQYFLLGCENFNQSLTIPDTVTEIGNSFLYQCYAFNSPLVLSSRINRIGSSFMFGCRSFNKPLTIPDNVSYIDGNFLSGCTQFNSQLTLSDNITSIGGYFLNSAQAFNQPLTLPSKLTSLGSSFLQGCTSFNQPIVLPDGLITINPYFMAECTSFASSLSLYTNSNPAVSSLTTIGNYFMSKCYEFNSPLKMPHGVKTVNNYFMNECKAFNQDVTLSQSLSSVGNHFMYLCDSMTSKIKIYNSGRPSDAYSLATTNADSPLYTTGVTVVGGYSVTQARAQEWKNSLPDSDVSPYRKVILGTPA